MRCLNCKYYESYHQDPNPNSITRHYCTKCDDVIHATACIDGSFKCVKIPKKCYFNDYFEESDEYKAYLENRYEFPENGLFTQVED